MAQKRMFNTDIVKSDAFLDMPATAQNLYWHLGMDADDDGFVNPKRVMRTIGAADDDLRVLLGKRFVLPFDSGVVVVKHWLINNLIRADLYKETQYKVEKKSLGLNENGAYTELRNGVATIKAIEAPKWLKERRGTEVRTANVPQTARRLGKVRLGKDSISTNVLVETLQVYDFYLATFKRTKDQYKLTGSRKKKLALRLKQNGLEQLKAAITNIGVSAWHLGDNDRGWVADLDWIIKSQEQVEKLALMNANKRRQIL